MTRRSILNALFLLLVFATTAGAEVKLPKLLSDGAVLQRDIPLHFWGTAHPAEQITVTLNGQTVKISADDLGRWHAYLAPLAAGGPYDVAIQGNNRIVLHDVMIGDVWIASGQSNMEFPMRRLKDADTEIAAANVPNLRLLLVKHTFSEYPLGDIDSTGWSRCSPETVRDFSAVAYYFARRIIEREHVAVGVIESSWGGTVSEAWTSLRALSSDPALAPVFASRAKMMEDYPETMLKTKQAAQAAEAAKKNGQPAPKMPWQPDINAWEPAALFNGMIAPLTPFPIRGVIWYQGESNSRISYSPHLYGRRFETLIRDWRERWGEGDFPFLFVQISSYTSTPAEDWPTVREGQRKTLALRNTGMAVTIDIGNPDDVHPLNKKDVGDRLALIARATVYGESVEYSGPLYRGITREPNALRVWFDHVGSGLLAKGDALTSFEVAGTDGKFEPATARIDGKTLVVSSAAVQNPVSIRYGWANSPQCNLFNREGLPASPFSASLPLLH